MCLMQNIIDFTGAEEQLDQLTSVPPLNAASLPMEGCDRQELPIGIRELKTTRRPKERGKKGKQGMKIQCILINQGL